MTHQFLDLAYIDPGTGAMVLQVIIASILGASFYFRRAITRPVSLVKSFFGKREIAPVVTDETAEELVEQHDDDVRKAA